MYNFSLSAAGIGLIVVAILIPGYVLTAWIWSMRRKIRRAEAFRRGIEKLLLKGIIPGVNRVCFERTPDGWHVAFEGPPNGPCHEVTVLDDPDFQLSGAD